jgi:hypothetical protein
VRFAFVADIQHHAAIVQLHGHGFARIGQVGIAHNDIAALPGIAVIVAVDNGNAGRPMGVSAGAGRKPNGNDQSAVDELDAVARPRGKDIPVVVAFELVEGRRDLGRLRECFAVIVAAQIKAAAIFDADEEMDRAGFAIDDGDRIVERDFAVLAELLLDCSGVALELDVEPDEVLVRLLGLAAVGAAAKRRVDMPPVAAGVLARFAIGEDGAVFRHNDARDAIERVAVLAGFKEIDLFEERLVR